MPSGLFHVNHYYISVQYSWEDGVMYDISMKYFHAERLVFFNFKMKSPHEWCYIYKFNIELLEIGLHFNMFYIKSPSNLIHFISLN